MRQNITKYVQQLILILLAHSILLATAYSQQQPKAGHDEVAKPLPRGRTFVPFGTGIKAAAPGPPAALVPFSSLTAGVNNELQLLTLEQAAQFQITPLLTDVDVKWSRKLLVRNFIAFNETTDATGNTVRRGAGIRWVMDVATSDVNTKFSFPILAAQAQLGTARASVKIYTIGINNDEINAAANVPTELNVENYFKMVQGFDKATGLIKGTLQVDPQIVEIITEVKDPTDEEYTKALLLSWTLARIKDKKSLKDAQDSSPISDASARAVIAEIYRLRTGITDPLGKPNDVHAAMAKHILRGMKITK